jgi:hypothetical protein
MPLGCSLGGGLRSTLAAARLTASLAPLCPRPGAKPQVDLFTPIMHTALLVWKHSAHYSTAARMAALLQEVCNDLIAQVGEGGGRLPRRQQQPWAACTQGPCLAAALQIEPTNLAHPLLSPRPQAQRFIPGPELLRMDPSEACDKLRLALKVLGGFKSTYFAYRGLSAAECPDNPWRFQNAAVFSRLDRREGGGGGGRAEEQQGVGQLGSPAASQGAPSRPPPPPGPNQPTRAPHSFLPPLPDTHILPNPRHMARCSAMLTLAGAVLQFSRLERVEVGGTKGVSAAIKAVHADFMAAYERFQQVWGRVAGVERGWAGRAGPCCWETPPRVLQAINLGVFGPCQALTPATHPCPSPPCQVPYDVMDVDAPGFAADHGALRAAISELEHRLGALIMQVGGGAKGGAVEFAAAEG